MDANQLMSINLGQNKISISKSIHKWYFPELRQIALFHNKCQ